MSQDSVPGPSAPPPPPAASLSQLLRGSLVTQLIHVAAKLGIADLLREGPQSSQELAAKAAVDPDALYRVLRALAGLGIVADTESGCCDLTPLPEPLRSDLTNSLRASAVLYGERWWWDACGELFQSVKTGQPAFDHVHGQPLFDYLGRASDAAAVFNQHQTSMTCQDAAAVIAAYDFSAFETIVDVGGGHGALALGIVEAFPRTSVILFDLPAVGAGAPPQVLAQGVAGRCTLVGGDFFVSVPQGGEAYVLKDIVHDWDDARATTILQNCRRAMTARRTGTSRLLVIEKVIPPGNEPFAGKLTDITMMLVAGGRERTAGQYRVLLAEAGFTVLRVVPSRSPASVIEAVPS